MDAMQTFTHCLMTTLGIGLGASFVLLLFFSILVVISLLIKKFE